MSDKSLHLVVTKKWFDLIKSGQKKEEYRVVKPFWEKRLKKEYHSILFQLGYSKNAPKMKIEYKGLETREIISEHFGIFPVNCYVLKLGEIIG